MSSNTFTSGLPTHRTYGRYDALVTLAKCTVCLPAQLPVSLIEDLDRLESLAADIVERMGAHLKTIGNLPVRGRQRQVLSALLQGDSEKEIAYRLRISHHTVHVYVKQLYARIGVSSRAELLSYWHPRVIFWATSGHPDCVQIMQTVTTNGGGS